MKSESRIGIRQALMDLKATHSLIQSYIGLPDGPFLYGLRNGICCPSSLFVYQHYTQTSMTSFTVLPGHRDVKCSRLKPWCSKINHALSEGQR
ncbi:hypothetical protein TNCV_189911 [Trichonephila clavipes]|nr:hypothetical protein TNCV_189911 [Trichonephila clavipes]